MATKYISTTGSNFAAGDVGSEWATVDYALTQPGWDTLIFRSSGSGSYPFSLHGVYGSVPVGSSWGAPITFMAFPGETVRFTGQNGGAIVNLLSDDGVTERPFYWIIQDIFLDATGIHNVVGGNNGAFVRFINCELAYSQSVGWLPGGPSYELINCHVHHCGTDTQLDHGVYVGSAFILIDGGEFDHNANYGIQFYHGGVHTANNGIVRNARIHHNRNAAILTSGDDTTMYNCYVWAIQDNGVSISESGPSNRNSLYFCSITGCGGAGVIIGPGSVDAKVQNNILFGNGSNSVSANNFGSGSQTIDHNLEGIDPGWPSGYASSGNLSITTSSPAYQAGTPIAGITADIQGTGRPTLTNPSCGAYEPIVGGGGGGGGGGIGGYNYRRSLTINHLKVPNTNQANFPVLSLITDPTWVFGGGGHVQNALGYDLVDHSDSALTNQLPFQQERYDNINGELIQWTKIASVTTGSDAVYYRAYSNPGISTYRGDNANTFESNFKGVWLFGTNPLPATIPDSTSNANNGANNGVTAIAGKIGWAGNFNGTSSYISGNFSPAGSFPCTISGWFKVNTVGVFSDILSIDANDASGFKVGIYNTDKLAFTLTGVADYVFTTLATIVAGTWYYFAVTVDAENGTVIGYLRASGGAVPIASESQGIGTSTGAKNKFHIGSKGNATQDFFPGIIDALMYASTVRSADWINTSFNNQDSPSTFITLGSEVFVGTASAIAVFEGTQFRRRRI